MEEKWSGEKVRQHFEGRAEEYIERARRMADGPMTEEKLRYAHNWDVDALLAAASWLKERFGTPASVVEFGCGAGTWVKFWREFMGARYYVGVDSSGPAIAAAREIWPAEGNEITFVESSIRDFHPPSADPDSPFLYEWGFTHGVLMHVPPVDLPAVLQTITESCRNLMLIERVRDGRPEDGGPHVWTHDYEAWFGKPVYQARINPFKDIFIFSGGRTR